MPGEPDTSRRHRLQSSLPIHGPDGLLVGLAQAELCQPRLVQAAFERLPSSSVVSSVARDPQHLDCRLVERGGAGTTPESGPLRGALLEARAAALRTPTTQLLQAWQHFQCFHETDAKGFTPAPYDHQVPDGNAEMVPHGRVVAVGLLHDVFVARVPLELPVLARDKEGPSPVTSPGCHDLHPSHGGSLRAPAGIRACSPRSPQMFCALTPSAATPKLPRCKRGSFGPPVRNPSDP